MESHEVQIGMLVRVSERHRREDYRGQTGLVRRRYGDPGYAAFDIRFLDGRSNLFWHHELEEARGFL